MQDIIMSKQGVTQVMMTALAIVVAIIAVSALFPIVSRLIEGARGNMLSQDVSCNEIIGSLPITIKDICYMPYNEIKLKVERSLQSFVIPSITFSLDNGGENEKWLCTNNCRNCAILSPGETKFYYLSNSKLLANNSAVTIYAGDCIMERKDIVKPCA